MDSIPFRGSTSRGQQEPDTPPPTEQPPERPHHRPAAHHKPPMKKESSFSPKIIAIIVAIVVVLVIGVVTAFSLKGNSDGGAAAIDGGKYQAVFFDNGQVYFGKLSVLDPNYFKLTEIYYLQANQEEQVTEEDQKNPQQTNTDQNANVQLIKLGNEIHGPQDEMIVSRDKVLFFENLKSDGKVSQSIEQFKNPNE